MSDSRDNNYLYPYSTYLIGKDYTDNLCPEYNFTEQEYIDYRNSGYWSDEEEDAWWYYYIYFPYLIPKEYNIYNNKVAFLYRIKKVFLLLGLEFDNYYTDEQAFDLFRSVDRADILKKWGDVYSLYELLLKFIKPVSQKVQKTLKTRLEWAKELRNKRENNIFLNPADLKYCAAYTRTRHYMGPITFKNLRAIFNLNEERIDNETLLSLVEPLENTLIIEGKAFINFYETTRVLVNNRVLDDKYYNIENYEGGCELGDSAIVRESGAFFVAMENDWREKVACYYLLNFVQIKIIRETHLIETPKTIPFSEFEARNIYKSDVLYAAEKGKIGVYVSGKVNLQNSDKGYAGFDFLQCDLLLDQQPKEEQNRRYKDLGKLQVRGLPLELNGEIIPLGLGLTVEMLRNNREPKNNRSDYNLGCVIECEPTDIERAHGVSVSVKLGTSDISKYLDYVVIVESEWEGYLNKKSKNPEECYDREREKERIDRIVARAKKMLDEEFDKDGSILELQDIAKLIHDEDKPYYKEKKQPKISTYIKDLNALQYSKYIDKYKSAS